MKRNKMQLYEQNVRLLKRMDGLEGHRCWRRELAEVLTKHDTKTKRDPTANMVLSAAQVVDVDDRLL